MLNAKVADKRLFAYHMHSTSVHVKSLSVNLFKITIIIIILKT